MKGGSIYYRCRRCGKVYTACHSPDWHASLAWAALRIDINPKVAQDSMAPELLDLHHCSDTANGVADLVGAEADDHKRTKEQPK